jgi:hypothetical protein
MIRINANFPGEIGTTQIQMWLPIEVETQKKRKKKTRMKISTVRNQTKCWRFAMLLSYLLYVVLVSELMLQQTQVATVIRYYETWMNVSSTTMLIHLFIHFGIIVKLWPNIKSLADASEDVLDKHNTNEILFDRSYACLLLLPLCRIFSNVGLVHSCWHVHCRFSCTKSFI